MEGRARLLTPVLQAGRTHLIKPHLAGPLWGPGHMSRGPHGGPIHCRGKPAVTSPHRLESVCLLCCGSRPPSACLGGVGPWSPLQSEGEHPTGLGPLPQLPGVLALMPATPQSPPQLPSPLPDSPHCPPALWLLTVSLRGALQPKEPFLCSSFLVSRTLFSVPRGVG